jgi:multidrug efflux pump subunit AcrB
VTDGPPERRAGGPIALFARHPTAGNLLMVVMLMLGALALSQLNRQFFPDFGIDVIQIQVVWPGASADDVEGAIVEAIEPEVRFLDGIKQVVSRAEEGVGGVYLEFVPGTDMERALSEAESAVAQVTTLPEDSERPTVKRIVRYDTIARIVLSGPFDEAALKRFAKDIRDDLLARGVDRVTFFGTRDEEIRVEVPPATLRRLDLTLDDVAAAIARASQDVPAGDLGAAFERQPRALGLARSAEEIRAIEVRATPSGRKLTVGDIGTVSEDFDEAAPTATRSGERAIEIHVQRALSSDALEIADEVEAYLEELPSRLPPSLRVEAYDVMAELIRGRIDLLLTNGFGGLVLVLSVLFLFLNARIAFWIAAGIPISMLAMLGVLWLAGMSINMISLFAMLLAVGIIVDDAIVVGEHAAALHEQGVPTDAAAELGALHMAAPVTSASLTTIASFLPILVVGDIIGEIIREIPLVVIAVLVASLIECFLVLPTHMRGALRRLGPPSRPRRAFDNAFARFREGAFRRLVGTTVAWRYATLAAAMAALILAVGVIMGGRVGFVFFSGPEATLIHANLAMAPGTSRAATGEALDAIDRALSEAAAETAGDPGALIVMSLGRLGISVGRSEAQRPVTGDNAAGLVVELVSPDERSITTSALIELWRERIPFIPGVENLTLEERAGGPPGREVDIRLRGGADTATLKRAALEVQNLLERLPGVSQIDDDLAYGKQEVLIELTPRGRALGFTTGEVGRQLRDALQGRIAKRFARGDEEVEVVVRLDDAAAQALTLQRFLLRSESGREIALGEVASLEEDRGFARIKREDGVREVAVTAELDEAQIKLDQVVAALTEGGLIEIAERYGLDYRFAGKFEEQQQTLGDIRVGAVIGLVLIYIILAWVFASFTRPFAVMLVIPFGLVGAVIGHMLLGYDLSILSLIALLGLSGILVNDSIILVTAIDQRIRGGAPVLEAVVDGTCARLRAVLLTSATTIGGLGFLLFETSRQAQFLIPMAITIVFGLMVTTLLVLVVVPALIGIQNDIGRLISRTSGHPAGQPQEGSA